MGEVLLHRSLLFSFLLGLTLSNPVFSQDKSVNNKNKKSKGKRNVEEDVEEDGGGYNPGFELYEASIEVKKEDVKFEKVDLKKSLFKVPDFKSFQKDKALFDKQGALLFKDVLEEVRLYLGDNATGKDITLLVSAGSSQRPSFFNAAIPSQKAKAALVNNGKLALSRSALIRSKLVEEFPEINVEIPSLGKIVLGKTAWSSEVQAQWQEAVKNNDEYLMSSILIPFLKEEYIRIESAPEFYKTVRPRTTDIYTISVHPPLTYEFNGNKESISDFIISQKLFRKIGGRIEFTDLADKDLFLERQNCDIYQNPKTKTWFMFQSDAELNAMKIEDLDERIKALFEVGIVEDKNSEILKEVLISKYLEGITEIAIEY